MYFYLTVELGKLAVAAGRLLEGLDYMYATYAAFVKLMINIEMW